MTTQSRSLNPIFVMLHQSMSAFHYKMSPLGQALVEISIILQCQGWYYHLAHCCSSNANKLASAVLVISNELLNHQRRGLQHHRHTGPQHTTFSGMNRRSLFLLDKISQLTSHKQSFLRRFARFASSFFKSEWRRGTEDNYYYAACVCSTTY